MSGKLRYVNNRAPVHWDAGVGSESFRDNGGTSFSSKPTTNTI